MKKSTSKAKAWTELSRKLRTQTPYCQKCGRKADECRLQVHHLLPRRLYPSLLLEERQLIVLCPKCHNFCRESAHKDGVAFAIWLQQAFPDKWQWLQEYLKGAFNVEERHNIV